jgi:hypothetical protein
VPAGSYTWDITVPDPPPTVTPTASGFPRIHHPDHGRSEMNGYWVSDPIHVGADDVEDLALVVRRGVSVRGRIEVEGAAISAPPISVRINRSDDRFGGYSVASFEIHGVKPGRYGLMAEAFGWTVTGAARSAFDLLDGPLVVGEDDVNGVVIRVSSSSSDLTGTVRDTTGAVVTNATVVVFPTDVRAWKIVLEESLRIRSARAVAGQYSFDHLPPGEYHVAVIDDGVLARWNDPAVFAALAATAGRVVVQLGVQRTMDVVKR